MAGQNGQSAVPDIRLGGLPRFLGLLREYVGAGPLAVLAGVSAALSFTDGIGLALLLPLLALLAPGQPAGIAADISALFGRAGMAISLEILLLVFLVLTVARAGLTRLRETMSARLRLRFVAALRNGLFRAIAEAAWPFAARLRGSDAIAALSSDMDRVDAGTLFAMLLPSRLLVMVVHLGLAFVLDARLTMLALATGIGLILLLRSRWSQSLGFGRALSAGNRRMHAEVADFFGALKIAKSHAAEERHAAQFAKVVAESNQRFLAFIRSSSGARAFQDVAGALILGVFVLLAVKQARLPLPDLLLMVLIFQRCLPLAQQVQQAGQQIAFMLPALDAILGLWARAAMAAEPRDDGAAAIGLNDMLRLEGTAFAHDGASLVLAKVTTAIPARTLTVISGSSGAGKSTLLDIIAGLQRPTSGRVLVDGRELTADLSRAWRRAIAYVPQDPFLFHDTLRQNLTVLDPEADDDAIFKALRLAGAEGVVAGMPEGLETMMGPRGIRLSGGERQRIVLARALLANPSLLLLDEATSALDVVTEAAILGTISALRQTVTIIMVTHRPEVVPQPDQQFVLAEGCLVAA